MVQSIDKMQDKEVVNVYKQQLEDLKKQIQNFSWKIDSKMLKDLVDGLPSKVFYNYKNEYDNLLAKIKNKEQINSEDVEFLTKIISDLSLKELEQQEIQKMRESLKTIQNTKAGLNSIKQKIQLNADPKLKDLEKKVDNLKSQIKELSKEVESLKDSKT